MAGNTVRSRFPTVLVLLTLVSCTWAAFASADSADGCDWTGSGLEEKGSGGPPYGQQRGVRPVYLRCSQGQVTWLYPTGALRVVLRYATAAAKEFQACLKLSSDFSGANVYVERHRVLQLVHGASRSPLERPDGRRHCFDSHNGQVALFLETDPNSADPLAKQAASFQYDLQPIGDGQHSDPWQECRPCSVRETLDLFCSSDFVARGTISSVYNDDLLQRTLLTVRATRVLRQVAPVFRPPPPRRRRRRSPASSNHLTEEEQEQAEEEEQEEQEEGAAVATLHVPRRCQAKHGHGEFVFMGRRRLGDAILWCAPRLEEWQRWIQQDQLRQAAQCRLQS